MAELVFMEEQPTAGQERPARPGLTIGREGCDVVLDDPEVSRRHAVLRQGDAGLAIEDLDSSNGTFVNGERVSGIAALNDGDSVKVGNTVWRLQAAAGATRIAQVRAAPPDRAPPEPPAPEPPVAPSTEPAQPPAAALTDGAGKRGDVPAPNFAPSAIRRVLPAAVPAQAPQFTAAPGSGRGSAARRLEATVVSYAVVIATAVAVIAYLAGR